MVGGELDSGDIIAREYNQLTQDTTITEAYYLMSDRIPILFGEALHLLEKDSTYIMEQQSTHPEDALRCYPRKPEDGRID
jgi:methionyl-tRNA formyltransferase